MHFQLLSLFPQFFCQFAKTHLPVFKYEPIVRDDNRTFASTSFLPHFFACFEIQAGQLTAAGSVNIVTHADTTAVMVGDRLVGISLLGRKTFISITDLEAVAAHIVGTGDEQAALVKNWCANDCGTPLAWCFPEKFSAFSINACDTITGKLDILLNVSNFANDE